MALGNLVAKCALTIARNGGTVVETLVGRQVSPSYLPPRETMTPRYECDQFGACCQGLVIIEADGIHRCREPRLLEATPLRVRHTIDELLSDLREVRNQCLEIAGRGPFRLRDVRCLIYPTHPKGACRDAGRR